MAREMIRRDMPDLLKTTRFGNPILREAARRLAREEILSDEVQTLIANMRHTVERAKLGVGLAAQQVGEPLALSVIAVKPTPTRPDREPFDMIMINPEIVETFGRRTGMWEGCVSCGNGRDTLYAKVPRYRKLRLRWLDERAESHERLFDGLVAHVIQHETDHMNGVLFVDRVRDTRTYMMADEFRRRIVKPGQKSHKKPTR